MFLVCGLKYKIKRKAMNGKDKHKKSITKFNLMILT